MKCFYGGSSLEGLEHTFRAACFAPDLSQARKLLWQAEAVREDCDYEYENFRVVRQAEHDYLFGKDGRDCAHVITDSATTREMGWVCDGDEHCAGCSLATMDGEFPICDECDLCAECGHEDHCPHGQTAQ